MAIECAYSFYDLFEAAHGRKAMFHEYETLMQCSQSERNIRVAKWAERAKWCTIERIGTDGQTYLAFFPPEAPCQETYEQN